MKLAVLASLLVSASALSLKTSDVAKVSVRGMKSVENTAGGIANLLARDARVESEVDIS